MPVHYEVSDAVAVITLDRAEVLNAFDAELGRAALAAVERASGDESVRCIVLTGAGRAFSSGEDLGALASSYEGGEAPDLGATLRHKYNPLVRAIRSAPKPVVAALNGIAAGAGAGLALACDFRFASDKAKLVLAFIKVGLVPDSGSVWFLTRYVGAAKAWELAAIGDPIDATEALRLGLVTQVTSAPEFEESWRSFARSLAAGPTRAYALAKSLVEFSLDHSLEQQLDHEIGVQTQAGNTQDHLEGVAAFMAKRAPRFEGK